MRGRARLPSTKSPRSKYLLSRKRHKKPAFAGSLYLTNKATIVALFALSKLFSSNFLKPSFASTSRTSCALVGSTFLSFAILLSPKYASIIKVLVGCVNRSALITNRYLYSFAQNKKRNCPML